VISHECHLVEPRSKPYQISRLPYYYHDIKTVRLMLNIGQSRKIPLKIEVGNGETFWEVWNSTTYLTNGFQNINLPEKTQGRYVRLSMTGENSDKTGWFSIVETEIWGDNLTGAVISSANVMESMKRDIKIYGNSLTFTKGAIIQEITLFNTAGRVLLRQNIGKDKNTVNINRKVVPGSYILRVKSNGIFRTGRIIISD